MEPMLSAAVAGKVSAQPPRDLLSRLYREIGISAVAGALAAVSKPSAARGKGSDTRGDLAKSVA